jgi:hypothetical protein
MANALLSLDAIEPALEDIGFQRDEAGQLREITRQYLELWAAADQTNDSSTSVDGLSFDSAQWLDRVRSNYGESLATRLAEMPSRFAIRPSTAREGWTVLMVRLPHEIEHGSKPNLPAHKLQAFMALAGRHLEAMKRTHERAESLASASSQSEWDRQLLASNFYPIDDGDDDSERRFDPVPLLWQLLSDREWRSFTEDLRKELSEAEILELVSWGKASPENAFGKYLSTAL